MTRAARTSLAVTLALLAGATLVAWRQWFPSAREPGYRPVATFGAAPGPGRLEGPIGVALLDGEVFVTDSQRHRIVVYDRNGGFLRAFGRRGAQPGQLDRPMHLTARSGRVYVAEYLNDRIQVFSPQGESLATIGGPGAGPGELDAPGGVAVDGEGNVYVADFYNQRVQVFAPDGAFLRQVGQTGAKGIRPGRFNYPTDVALLPGGEIVVADAYNDRVQVFGPTGDPVRRWGGPLALGIAGSFHSWFRVATGVAAAPDGSVFVADFYNHRIQKLTAAGDFLVAFGSQGAGAGELDRPTDMAVADDGTVYVTDFGNGRVQAFVPVQGDTG
jgi:DNA-binding beta-propeller fold protein YncE